MNKIESLEDFYKRKFDWMPDNIRNEIGHFNLFRLEPYVEGKPTSRPYKRRDFYKIMLVKGQSQIHFADKVVAVKKQALSFSNPLIPYKWEHLDKMREGIYCIFNSHFFHQFGQLNQYEVFQPNRAHIFELSDDEVNASRKSLLPIINTSTMLFAITFLNCSILC
jgi:AraC family transcriptional regulator, transcriptional activator of pobA